MKNFLLLFSCIIILTGCEKQKDSYLYISNKNSIIIYSKPNIKSKIVKKINKAMNYEFQIVAKNSNPKKIKNPKWINVKAIDGHGGYVLAEYLNKIPNYYKLIGLKYIKFTELPLKLKPGTGGTITSNYSHSVSTYYDKRHGFTLVFLKKNHRLDSFLSKKEIRDVIYFSQDKGAFYSPTLLEYNKQNKIKNKHLYVLFDPDAYKVNAQPKKAWIVNLKTNKFEEISTEGFRCTVVYPGESGGP